MTGIVIAVLFLIAATRSSKSAPDEKPLVSSVRSGAQLDGSSVSGAVSSERAGRIATVQDNEPLMAGYDSAHGQSNVLIKSPAARSEECKSARRAVPWYRGRQRDWLKLRGVERVATGAPSRTPSKGANQSTLRKPRSCPDARYLAQVAKRRSFAARQSYYRWQETLTLRDFPFTVGGNAWPKAVREVQRVFPGTEGWLLSCSAAEGGHGRWVGYGGQGYSVWLRDSDTVGGPLQFRYSTFKGMFRRGVDHAYAHGFRVPIFTSLTDAWRSALGQALAGGWARYTGNDNSHWSASFGRGC